MAKSKVHIYGASSEKLFESLRTGSLVSFMVDGLIVLACSVVKIEAEDSSRKGFLICVADGKNIRNGYYDVEKEVGWLEI